MELTAVIGVIGTIGSVALFWLFMRDPHKIWELEALDRLVSENPAWAKYRDPIVWARQARDVAPTPELKAVWTARLNESRVAAQTQMQAYLIWLRVPSDAADKMSRSPEKMGEIQADIAASAGLDPDLFTAADLALRARLLPPS